MNLVKMLVVYVWLDSDGFHARNDGFICREVEYGYRRIDGSMGDIKISDLMKVTEGTIDKKHKMALTVCLLKDRINAMEKLKQHIADTLSESEQKNNSDFVSVQENYFDFNVKIS